MKDGSSFYVPAMGFITGVGLYELFVNRSFGLAFLAFVMIMFLIYLQTLKK